MHPSWDLARWTEDPPVLEGGIYRVFSESFRRDPARVALETPDGVALTYGELGPRVDLARLGLADCGVAPGDRVLAYVEKSVASVLLYLACLSRGAVYIPVNPGYTPAELAPMVQDARPRLVVCDASRRPEVAESTRGFDVGVLQPDGLVVAPGGLSGARRAGRQRGPTGSDPAVVLYTSGTTGKPRGAVLTHRAVLANGLALCRVWDFTCEDVLVHALPLFHTHGLLVALNCALLSGSSIRFMTSFDPITALGLWKGATVFMGVPTYYTRMLAEEALSPAAAQGMRLLTCGSAPLLPRVWEDFHRYTGHRIVERYGMTEVGIITSNPVDGERLPGTVGFPLEGVEVKVVDRTGAEVGPGVVGELCTASAGAFSGYLNQPDQTALIVDEDGWVSTGDLASVDVEGRVTLAGRAKDLVITGGLNVHPLEVETVLDSLPGVMESAVFGVPHPDFGEGVVAAVIWDGEGEASPQRLRRALASRLAGHKIPKRILVAPSLPRNAMGKVQKNVLRSRHANLFEAAVGADD